MRESRLSRLEQMDSATLEELEEKNMISIASYKELLKLMEDTNEVIRGILWVRNE